MWHCDRFAFYRMVHLDRLRRWAEPRGVLHPITAHARGPALTIVGTDSDGITVSINLTEGGSDRDGSFALDPKQLHLMANEGLNLLRIEGLPVEAYFDQRHFVVRIGRHEWRVAVLAEGVANPLTRYAGLEDERLGLATGLYASRHLGFLQRFLLGDVPPPLLAPRREPGGPGLYVDQLGMVFIEPINQEGEQIR